MVKFDDLLQSVRADHSKRLVLADQLSTEEDMRRFLAALAEKVQRQDVDIEAIKVKLGL